MTRDAQEKELDIVRRIAALARTGLHFSGPQYAGQSHGDFERQRYEEILALTAELTTSLMNVRTSELIAAWHADDGYVTPKVDVRGAAFKDDGILLIRERSDGKWALPGGWADVNETPSQAVAKEIEQESGFSARAVKLVAVHDRRIRNVPASIFYIYKLFFLCEITGGSARVSDETDAVDFFALDKLPELSSGRTVRPQIERMFAHRREPSLPTEFD